MKDVLYNLDLKSLFYEEKHTKSYGVSYGNSKIWTALVF